jgi:hypothetical protein
MHAKIENGVIVEYPIINLLQYIPNSSLPVDLTNDNALPEGYVYVNFSPLPEYDNKTQRIIQTLPIFVENKWVMNYEVVNLTQEEIDALLNQQQQYVKEQKFQAYKQESDPLFFKAQRGESTMEEWLAKVNEIKERYK